VILTLYAYYRLYFQLAPANGFVDFGDYARDDDALRIRRVA